jgi:hypothetical protein
MTRVNGERLIARLCLKARKKLCKICCAGLAKTIPRFLLRLTVNYSQLLFLPVLARVLFSNYREGHTFFQQILTSLTKRCQSVISLSTISALITNLCSAISSMDHTSITLRWKSLISTSEVITLLLLLILWGLD